MESAIDLGPPPGKGTLALVVRCEGTDGAGLPGAEVQLEGRGHFEENLVAGLDGEVVLDDLPDDLVNDDVEVTVFARRRVPKSVTIRAGQPWAGRVVLRMARE